LLSIRCTTPAQVDLGSYKISLKGHYTFHNDEKLIDLDAIVAGLDLG